MRKKQKRKIIAGVIFTILCGVLVFGLVINPKTKGEELTKFPQEQPVETKKIITTTAAVVEGSAKQSTSITSTSVSKQAIFKVAGEEFIIQTSEYYTVYDAMNSLRAQGKITFEGKEYPGLGFFVTQINSLKAGDGKNLMYYINGEEASAGVSTYVFKEGDNIEWKLK